MCAPFLNTCCNYISLHLLVRVAAEAWYEQLHASWLCSDNHKSG